MDYRTILESKKNYYGNTEAAYEFAAEQYAIRKMLQENESMLAMAKFHGNERIVLALTDRITELKLMIK